VKTPLIFEIKGGSLDDGPGIRTVIFFKGCPLSCMWCHNPEGMSPGFEHSFDSKECIRCLICVENCGAGAISYADKFKLDKAKCIQCFTCVSMCPTGALDVVGKSLGIEKIVESVLKDKPFFETSGGGVTLSGGEPTLNMDFSSMLVKRFKEEGIKTLLETCGFFNYEDFAKKMLPWLDAIYFDIKLFDVDEHKKYCGVGNDKILNNFKKLLSESSVEILPRIPLVPGITDTKANLNRIAGFLISCGVSKVKLLSYNPLWPDKLEKFWSDSLKVPGKMRQFMKPDHLKNCRAFFENSDIKVY